jgi:hypothetical protein
MAMVPTPRPTSTEAQKSVNRYRSAGLIVTSTPGGLARRGKPGTAA